MPLYLMRNMPASNAPTHLVTCFHTFHAPYLACDRQGELLERGPGTRDRDTIGVVFKAPHTQLP